MKVKDLIAALAPMPPDAEVWHLWDGHPYTAVELVWLARSGDVVTADYGMVCYPGNARPLNAPTVSEEPYWETAANPDPENWKEFPYDPSPRPREPAVPTTVEPFNGEGISGRAYFTVRKEDSNANI